MPAEELAWIDADGQTTALQVDWDVDGRFMPPIRRTDDIIPLQAGGRVSNVAHGVRDVSLAVWFTAADETTLRSELRAIVAAFDPARGDGRLRVTGPDGSSRDLYCQYLAGLEMPERLGDTAGPNVQAATVEVRAVDPYWYDSTTVVLTFETGEAATFFPIFPIRLSSSEVFADASIDNTGDVEAWPVWTVTGPGSGLVLRNLTTGKSLSLTYTLSAGETATIDTRPGEKTITLGDGTNLFQYLSATSSLWPLVNGANSVQVELSGSTADSSVVVSYQRRFLTA